MSRTSDKLFYEKLTSAGKRVFDFCRENEINRSEFCERIGITYPAFCYKMKGYHGGFTKAEAALINSILALQAKDSNGTE